MKQWLAIGIVILGGAVQAADFSRQLAEVKTGTRAEARASWWGFNKDDATGCLQAAVNSGVKKLRVDNTGYDWVVGPIKVPSNLEIIFADGVVIRAKPGEFWKRTDKLFDIAGQTNVTLRGEGQVRFIMNKADYQNPDLYTRGEHRHTVNIYNSRNVLIENLTLESSGGDGVYVGSGGTGEGAKNITLERLICLNHHRQGISVTGVENLLIKNCKFNDTKGTAPQCGINYEPNYARFSLVNCVAVNCEFNGNADAGINLSLRQLDAASLPVSIAFRNCRVRGNPTGVRMTSTGSGTPAGAGRIEFVDCVIADNGESIAIGEHRVNNLALGFKGNVIDNRRSKVEAVRISSGRLENVVGLRIEGLTVIDDTDRAPIRFLSRFSNGLVDSVVTGVKVRNSTGQETAFDGNLFLKNNAPLPADKAFKTRPLELKTMKPLNETGQAAGAGIRFRQKTDYLLWAKAGQAVRVKFTNKPVHRYEHAVYRGPLEVVIWSPSQALTGKFGITFDGVVEYTLNAAETGVYRFEIDARMQTVCIEAEAPGQGVSAAETLYVFGCSGRLYFQVPSGVKEIAIEAGGSPHETSSVFLLDPEGRQADSGVALEGSRVLRATRPDVSRAEIWSLRFSAAKLFLRIGAPLVPVFSTNPANLLINEPEKNTREDRP